MITPATLLQAFREGGWGMYPLLGCLGVIVVIAIERAVVLFLQSSRATLRFESEIKRCILAGELREAIEICARSRVLAAKVVQAGLEAAANPDRQVQMAMDLAVLRERPRVARRTPYLAVTANLGMLLGLLGTVTGLTRSYHDGCGCDPTCTARVLAQQISEAMNCTALGLFVATASLCAFAVLSGRARRLEDDMSYLGVHLVGLVVANRGRLGLAGPTR